MFLNLQSVYSFTVKTIVSILNSFSFQFLWKMMKYAVIALILVAGVCAMPQKRGDEVTVLRSEFDDQADGTFRWASELSDGFKQEQSGVLKQIGNEKGIQLTGFYEYTSPEGQVIKVNYIADENGFQPTGDHLPGNAAAAPARSSRPAPRG